MKLLNRMVMVAILLLFEQCIYVFGLWEWLRFMPKIGRGGLFDKRRLQRSSSSSSTCTQLTVSSTVISELLSRVPTLMDDEKKLSLVALSNPAFRSVETVIEYYEQTIPSFVTYFEEAAKRPSIVSSPSFYSQLTSVYQSLDSAVHKLIAVEQSHLSVSLIQPELQLLMQTYSSVVTELKAEALSSSPSMASAGSAIRHAELTIPNLLTDAINIEAVAIEFPSVTDAIRAIGSYIYSAPPSIDSVISQLLDSSASTSQSYLVDVSSYSTLLNAVKSVAAVLRESASMRSPFVDLVDAAESVNGVLNAVDAELSSHDKTFEENLSSLSSLEDSWPPITAAVEWLEILEASNPSLSNALNVIEASLYLSGQVVHQLINAQEYPSLVTDWTAISYARMSHESVVSAIETFLKVESLHPSIVYTMQAVAYKIFSLETRDRTLLTAIKSIIAETNPSFANAAGGLRTVAYVEPFVAAALESFQSAVQQSPSLRCDEEQVAYYDQYIPQVVAELRDALSSPSTVSSLTSFRTLEDSYSGLMSVLRSIYSAENSVSSLSSILSQVNYALVYDPSVTKQWSIIGSIESGLTSKVNYVSSASSPQSATATIACSSS